MQPTRFTLCVLLLALAACGDGAGPLAGVPAEAARLVAAPTGAALSGRYVVVLHPGADPRSVAAVSGVRPTHVYTSAIQGFAAALNAGQLSALRHHRDVAYVEQDQAVSASVVQNAAPWNLDRIDQWTLPLTGTYTYNSTGSTVNAYVIDSGIYTMHTQFGGRASNVYDALGGNGQDCHGHGTHVAGIVGATTYGVAKQVKLRGVRVLDCNGSGTISGIIAGVDWVRMNRANPAVANLSLSAGYSPSLNTAVTSLSTSGVFTAVAAGNDNQDACNVSPASAPAVTTVAASTITDARASYSNYGSCVDLYAPGSDITSTWLNGGTRTLSGTSMASPHVAAVGALYKSVYGNVASSTIDVWIKNAATAGVITGNPPGTPNLLLNRGNL